MFFDYVKILNDKIKVDTGVDWIAICALVVSISTLIWQWKDRKRDIKQQQWTALYPHRLNVYHNLLDWRNRINTKSLSQQSHHEIYVFFHEMRSKIISLHYEMEILFDDKIIDILDKIYNEYMDLMKLNFNEFEETFDKEKLLLELGVFQASAQNSFEELKETIKEILGKKDE